MNTCQMSHGVLVGYDGSAPSVQALEWAGREASLRGVPLTVGHAFRPGFPMLPDDSIAFELSHGPGHRKLMAGLARARELTSGLEVYPILLGGGAGHALSEHSEHAELVVVGSRGLGGVAGMLMGSVSSHLVAHAHAPAVIVRGSARGTGEVVVGFDGSGAADAALTVAFEEAAMREVPLCAVHNWDGRHDVVDVYEARIEFQDTVEIHRRKHADVTVRTLSQEGDLCEALLSAASPDGLVVVGCHRTRRPVAGSMTTAQLVARLAPCPVIVVRSHHPDSG